MSNSDRSAALPRLAVAWFALIGLVVGAALGCLAGVLVTMSVYPSRTSDTELLVAAGGALGTLIGGLVGAVAAPIARYRQQRSNPTLEDAQSRPTVDVNPLDRSP